MIDSSGSSHPVIRHRFDPFLIHTLSFLLTTLTSSKVERSGYPNGFPEEERPRALLLLQDVIHSFNAHDRHHHSLSRFVVGKVVDDRFVGKQPAGDRHLDFDSFSLAHSFL